MPSSRYPQLAFRFNVEIDSIQVGSFSECSGIQVETEVEEIQVGGLNDWRPKLPKGSKYGNLVLKRGITDSDVLWKWHQQVVAGKFERKNVAIVLWNERVADEQWRWTFKDAFPVKWTGPELKGDSSAVAVETLELAHHGRADTAVKQGGSGA